MTVNFSGQFAVLDIVCEMMPRLFHTMSFRLTALYAAVAVASFSLVYFFAYAILTSTLRDQIRGRIAEDVNSIAVEASSDGYSSAIADINERVRDSRGQGIYYYLTDPSGQRRAGNLDGIPLVAGWTEHSLDDVIPQDATNGIDEDHELWGEGRFLKDGSFLYAGLDAHQVLSAQEDFINTFLWLAGMALFIVASAGVVISHRFLRRIDAINRTSVAIMDGRLKARIPVRNSPDEIDQMSINLNRLFESNQRLLESLKQVSASIAHDLRTPLGRLRQSLEEALAGPGEVEELKGAIEAAVIDSSSILKVFSALLRIAQVESGNRKAAFRAVDLSTLLQRLAAAYAPVAEDDGKRIRFSIEEGVTITGDEDLLLQAVANLIENALRHTPSGTDILVGLKKTGPGIELMVADTGPGIPPEMRSRVFERFFRLDKSRSTPGSGLGLALVAAVAELHGMDVHLEDNGPGLRVKLVSREVAHSQLLLSL